jgi:hypothetical protein
MTYISNRKSGQEQREQNLFRNIPIGAFVKFANNTTLHVVRNKRVDVYGGVLQETILSCFDGDITREVGHMDKEASGLEIIQISPNLFPDLQFTLRN